MGTAAFVMSFAALADLAYLAGIRGTAELFGFPLRLAYLFPLSVDAFAVAASIVWLRRRANDDAIRVARWSAWSAIGATVVGNGYHAFAVAQHDGPVPWPIAVVISAVPPVALGAVVHLAVLVSREPDRPDRDDDQGDPDSTDEPDQPDRTPDHRLTSDAPDDALVADLRAWAESLGEMPGRDRVVRRYGVGATRASKLRRNAGRPVVVSVVADEPQPDQRSTAEAGQ
ncbi:DUF2637 domain-containing protein [Pseudonocardia sp. McavD-2-B]|uniref:DUF2637 domain-containing protein n=1 Tax=Pseudonocardia sp. McavD-2-B TaxID=2954499 RepID=UPI0027E32EF3|nr:DUF2637 domain-containing protein [Pseudonocardia sp. McavD-2-B]